MQKACNCTSYAKATTLKATQQITLTHLQKPCIFDVSFIELEFPPLKKDTNTKTSNNTTNSTSNLTTAASSILESVTPPYNYKAKLDHLLKEIETTLHPQFECLFAQLEQKINSLVQSREEQEKVNINVLKQLNFLVENVTKLLKHLVYQLYNNSQSPCSGDGQS